MTVPTSNIRTFEVDWNSEGISPSTVPEHGEYMDNLCREVEYLMKEKITDSINKRIKADVSDPLYEEVVQHLKFCQTKCSTFYGRKEILGRCRAYLQVKACFKQIPMFIVLVLHFNFTLIDSRILKSNLSLTQHTNKQTYKQIALLTPH